MLILGRDRKGTCSVSLLNQSEYRVVLGMRLCAALKSQGPKYSGYRDKYSLTSFTNLSPLWYIQTRELYLALKREELLIHPTAW